MPTDVPISPDPVNDGRMTRAKFLAAGGGALAAGLLAACGGSSSGSTTTHEAASKVAKGGTLNIYTWPNYFSPKNLAAYKRETGTTMNISTYDSDDVLFAKLNSAAGAGFDLVVPSSGFVLMDGPPWSVGEARPYPHTTPLH